ncbi:MAG: hypothetical protein DLM69_07865 [Candidatus Chloroheliales bacterium]|nr:MAG: hypothetical protein DLM69_07865 [Chloroflexota bacterium]
MDSYYYRSSRYRMFDDYSEPFGWWGGHWSPPVPLSVIQIIESGSMNARMVALAWLMIERHNSLMFASEPPMAGKTTTMTAFIDFIPRDQRRIYLRGMYESFQFEEDGKGQPPNSWLLVNEFSNHLPTYLWGPKASRAFSLLEEGYCLGGTMHADSAEEAVAQLHHELGVSDEELAQLGLLFIVRMYNTRTGRPIRDEYEMPYGSNAVLRRVATGHLLSLGDDGKLKLNLFTRWERTGDHHNLTLEPHLPLFAARTGLSVERVIAELDKREQYLTELCARGIHSISAVREAIDRFRHEA